MFIKRTSLKQIRIVYLIYFLMFSRVARSLVRVQIVRPWLASYQKSWFYEAPAPNEFIRVMACSLWKDVLKLEHSTTGALRD